MRFSGSFGSLGCGFDRTARSGCGHGGGPIRDPGGGTQVGALFKELDEDGSGALDKQEPLWLQRSSTEQAGGEGAVERDCIQIC